MIQARKTQYMCMSKLSAKELASRAHQFLADGDKKKRQANSKDISADPEGLYNTMNQSLIVTSISVCN